MSLRDLARGGRGGGRQGRPLTGKEVRRIKKRGYDAERELVQKLRSAGFDALRIPVSAPSSEPLPDVFAVKGDTILAFEVKSQARYVYFKRDQVLKLHRFLDIHRHYPKRLAVLAAKFRSAGWTFAVAKEVADYALRADGGISLQQFLESLP